jgi:phosphinothricin acetyltransferase
VTIRDAGRDDLESIRTIYNQGIDDRIATLDAEPKTADDMEAWWADHGGRYAVLVATEGLDVIGWASINRYSRRRAYDGVADLSIYIDRKWRGRGVGRRLLTALETVAARNDFYKIVLFAFSSNTLGHRLYRRRGFREVGVFHEQGRLDGRRIDVTAMEKLLRVHG